MEGGRDGGREGESRYDGIIRLLKNLCPVKELSGTYMTLYTFVPGEQEKE